jgi:hypothetical protein
MDKNNNNNNCMPCHRGGNFNIVHALVVYYWRSQILRFRQGYFHIQHHNIDIRKKTIDKLYLINPSFEKFNLEQMSKYGLFANDDKISYLIGVFLQKVMAVVEGGLHYYGRLCNICFFNSFFWVFLLVMIR